MSMHISAKPGEIAERILLPGDPMRAKYIAETYLENPVLFNEIRGMWGYTGTYNGVPVSVMGTGMGVPSMLIYCRELMTEYGCKTLVRIGTGGAYDPDVRVGEVVISKGCCYTSNVMIHADIEGTFSATADYELVHTAATKAKEMGIPARVGLTVCNDALYMDDKLKNAHQWNRYGVIASEQEAFALYALASEFRTKAVTLISIGRNIVNPIVPPVSAAAKERELDNVIRLAIETAIQG